jgi:hypothetical protein
VVKQGWYAPEQLLYRNGRMFLEHTTKCATSEHGQLPNHIRERHGLPLLEDGVFRARTQTRKKAWDKRYEPPKTADSDARTPGKPSFGTKKADEAATAATPAATPTTPAGPVAEPAAQPAAPAEAPPMND